MRTFLHAHRKPLSWSVLLAALLLKAGSSQAQVDTYTFAPSTGTYTPLAATATNVANIQADDDISPVIPLGFSFVFDGTAYTSCKVSSNGWLTFNTSTTNNSLTNDLATGQASERPLVAPFWDDLNGNGGTARYATTGTAPNRTFTFEWFNWYRYSNTGPSFSMQVQLVEGTNVVRFVYRQEANGITGASVSIGLSGVGSGPNSFLSLSDASAAPAVNTTVENNSISTRPATGQIYSFTPPVPAACPAPRNLTATSVSTTTAQLNWTVLTGTGPFTVQYGPAGFNPALPSSPTNLYTTITTTSPTAAITGLSAQTTYQFFVTQNCGTTLGSSTRSNAGGFTTQITNDEPCTAIVLPVTNTCTPVSATTFGATTTPPNGYTNVGNCNGFNSTPLDVWFRFTTAATGPTSTQVRISVTGGAAEILRGFSGALCSGPLTSLNCTGTASGTAAPNLDLINLTPSTTYFVRVSNYDSFQPVLGPFTICATPVPNCPAPAGLTASNLTNTTANVSWSATSGGTGSTYTVFYGPNGFSPTAGGTSVANITATNTTLTGLTANTAYQFYVQQVCGGFNGSSTLTGPFSFTTPLTAPANDEPCGAVALGTASLSSSNVGATTSVQNGINLPACSPAQLPKDVWYTFTPTGTSTTLTLTGSAAGMVRVFTSPNCSAGPFTQVFCQSSGTPNTATGAVNVTGLTANTRYYIAVSGYGSSDASGSFTVVGSGLATATRTQAETDALVVYPNPSNTGQLALRLSGVSGSGKATLLNALGQVVLSKNLTVSAEQSLTTRGLAAGVYTLRVDLAGQVLTRKVVLE